MLVLKKVTDLQKSVLSIQKNQNKNRLVGFVPTMGALHEGHLQLVRQSQAEGCLTVVSIFVNPTQFNDPRDLEKYPRMPTQDMEMLLKAYADILFMPPVEEVYPPGLDVTLPIEFGPLEQVMEGEFRPGHFKGMATVVNRLLEIVQPDNLYMGQKDFQQMTIVRDMLRQQKSTIHLIGCPTVREPDGLAMSSRNMRLTPEMRAVAPIIYQTLQQAKVEFAQKDARTVEQNAMRQLSNAGLKPEYFEIVNGLTLQPVQHFTDADLIVACVATFAGEIRLIDNLVLKGNL